MFIKNVKKAKKKAAKKQAKINKKIAASKKFCKKVKLILILYFKYNKDAMDFLKRYNKDLFVWFTFKGSNFIFLYYTYLICAKLKIKIYSRDFFKKKVGYCR